MVAALAVTTPAVAHHSVPIPKQKNLVRIYEKMYKQAEKKPHISAGRNVYKHGRAKDGKVKWSVVREEYVRLWNALHPEAMAEHRERVMFPTPAWWLASAAPVAECESGGNPTTNTGNGFYGKWQFDWGTWASVGGSGNAAYAPEAEQDYRAYLLWRSRGWQPWPACQKFAG